MNPKQDTAAVPQKPLQGQTIVVTRAATQASALEKALCQQGAMIIVCPMINLLPAPDPIKVNDVLKRLEGFDWVIFTSVNGVEYTVQALQRAGLTGGAFQGVNIAAVGPRTRKALLAHGLTVDLCPQVYKAQALFEALQTGEPQLNGLRILLPQADIARKDLADALRKAGCDVTPLVVYQTVSPSQDSVLTSLMDALKAGQVDIITFCSPSAVQHFHDRMTPFPRLLEGIQLASIGPVTSEAVLALLGRVDIEATSHTIPGLVQAIIESVMSKKENPHVHPNRH